MLYACCHPTYLHVPSSSPRSRAITRARTRLNGCAARTKCSTATAGTSTARRQNARRTSLGVARSGTAATSPSRRPKRRRTRRPSPTTSPPTANCLSASAWIPRAATSSSERSCPPKWHLTGRWCIRASRRRAKRSSGRPATAATPMPSASRANSRRTILKKRNGFSTT